VFMFGACNGVKWLGWDRVVGARCEFSSLIVVILVDLGNMYFFVVSGDRLVWLTDLLVGLECNKFSKLHPEPPAFHCSSFQTISLISGN
jgi:hypothetical protein